MTLFYYVWSVHPLSKNTFDACKQAQADNLCDICPVCFSRKCVHISIKYCTGSTKGPRNDVSNFGPIPCWSNGATVPGYIELNRLLAPVQHDFMKSKSTIQVLIVLVM